MAKGGRTNLMQPQHDGSGQYTPHRVFWPSYWGTIQSDRVRVLNPEVTYELVRRELKVRRDFVEDLSEVKLSLKERTEVLGDEARARLKPEDWTEEEQNKLAAAESAVRTKQIAERISASLAAIEAKYPGEQAVFVSGGVGYVRDGDTAIKPLDGKELFGAAEPYAWPLAHNVRSAQQSLGATGCTACHSDGGAMFQASVTPVGVLPGQQTEPIAMVQLQGSDRERLALWNQLFAGRATFKIFGLIALGITVMITISTISSNATRYFTR
jgi:hypothetical protein